MHSDIIKESVENLSREMLAKGLRNPTATAMIEAHVAPCVYLHWGGYGDPDERTEITRDPDIQQAIDDAFALVRGLPSPEEAKRDLFMRSLAKVIDLGRENGIEVDFLNPLTETMKRLSENALTYQPTPPVTLSDAADYDDGNITP